MKKIRYFVLLLFIFSALSFTQEKYNKNDYEWLMMKQEKRAFKKAKTDEERKRIIEQFYEARDPDTFTEKNEFKLNYQENLKKVRKKYSNRDDARRYIYLLFGEPKSKRAFTDQTIVISNRIRANKGEIWQYSFGKQNFQVIFATLDPRQLQWFKDQSNKNVSPFSFSSSRYEILYIGSERYIDIIGFLENFFQESFRLQATLDTINQLKKSILDRAKEFYKKLQPKVKKEKYLYNWNNKEIQILITQFDVMSPKEVNIVIWIIFDKESLYYDSNKKEHRSDISLYCELRDANNKRIIYYQDDCAIYKLKEKKRYYYHFWGSAPSGSYRLILELGDNFGKRYTKIEPKKNISIFDYSKQKLNATFLVGKIIKDKDVVRGKPNYFSFKEGIFYPAASGEVFKNKDELIAIFTVSGFRKNHYGNSYVETGLRFVKGEIEQGDFVESNEIYEYRFLPVERSGSRFQSVAKIKMEDFNRKFKLSPGLFLFRVRLIIIDAIANLPYVLEYSRSIRIFCYSINNLNLRRF